CGGGRVRARQADAWAACRRAARGDRPVTVSWPQSAPPRSAALLTLVSAERTYEGPPPVMALKPTTLRIDAGDPVSLMGRSGSGKSTLLNLMGLLDKPTSGVVLFADVDTGRLADRQVSALRSANIGFVFQSFNLIPQRTAVENVALGLLYQRIPRSSRAQ